MRGVAASIGIVAIVAIAASCKEHRDAARACRDASECASGEYCAFRPMLCGRGKRAGSCVARPRACPAERARAGPVCACDGKTYANECEAHAAGVDLAATGGCKEAIPDFAPCGPRYCDARTSYCEIFLSDVPDLPTDHFCRPLPASCLPDGGAPRTCDCFPATTRCRSFCGPLAAASGATATFHLTCQGRLPPSE